MQGKVTKTYNIDGETFTGVDTASGDGKFIRRVDVTAAKTGSLTTRTDSTSGTLTLASGHGVTTGNRLDLYFDGGQRRGVVVGTVSVNAVPISSGSGSNLPILSSVLTVKVPQRESFQFAGDNLVTLAMATPTRGQIIFVDASNAELHAFIFNDGQAQGWQSGDVDVNPLATDAVDGVFFSHEDATKTVSMKVGALLQ